MKLKTQFMTVGMIDRALSNGTMQRQALSDEILRINNLARPAYDPRNLTSVQDAVMDTPRRLTYLAPIPAVKNAISFSISHHPIDLIKCLAWTAVYVTRIVYDGVQKRRGIALDKLLDNHPHSPR